MAENAEVLVAANLRGGRETLDALRDMLSAYEKPRLRGLLKRIGERILVPSFRKTLDSDGHGRWPPHRRVVRKHRMLGGEGKIARGLAVVATDRKVLVGTTSGFGPWAQFGFHALIPAETPKKKPLMRLFTAQGVVFATKVKSHAVTVPKREFLVIQDADADAIIAEVQRYIDRRNRRTARAALA